MGHGVKDKNGRSLPITPYAGSWAQSQQHPEAYARHIEQRVQQATKKGGK